MRGVMDEREQRYVVRLFLNVTTSEGNRRATEQTNSIHQNGTTTSKTNDNNRQQMRDDDVPSPTLPDLGALPDLISVVSGSTS